MMSPKEHDMVFSITSHLPHLIAYNLVKTATDFEKEKKVNEIIKKYLPNKKVGLFDVLVGINLFARRFGYT